MHINIPNFLLAEECKLIEKVLLDKEKEILSLPVNSDYYTGTTARYEHYNFLKYIPEVNIIEKLFALPIMQDEDECWRAFNTPDPNYNAYATSPHRNVGGVIERESERSPPRRGHRWRESGADRAGGAAH